MSIEIIPQKPVPPQVKWTTVDSTFTAYISDKDVEVTGTNFGGCLIFPRQGLVNFLKTIIGQLDGQKTS